MRLTKLVSLLLLCSCCRLVLAADTPFPRPAALAPDVQFWVKVYTEVTTDAGFIHDQRDLSVIYETLRFDAGTSIRERQHRVDAERERFHEMLLRLGSGVAPATDEERHVRALWGDVPLARLTAAADDVRFQLGQADRFRAGLIRSGAWEAHIADVFARLGLPPELAVLPHVESSFNPAAYSKVGAAGLWQFVRSTGRRFLRINSSVDERLDPFRETEAAAQLLSYDYRLLGSWPLAITAYNHGAEGMRRARDEFGDDIVHIVRNYHSPTFGFASRNFYVSFLAALTVAQDPEHYFGSLELTPRIEAHELKMPTAASMAALLPLLGVDRETLQRLNPGLRPAVWSGRRLVPAGYVLRLPDSSGSWTAALLAQRLTARGVQVASAGGVPRSVAAAPPQATRLALASASSSPGVASANPAQTASPGAADTGAAVVLAASIAPTPPVGGTSAATATAAVPAPAGLAPAGLAPMLAARASPPIAQYYLVEPGDTLSSIADRTGVPLERLLTLNGMHDQDFLYEGEPLRLVASAPELGIGTSPAATSLLAQEVVHDGGESADALALTAPAADNQPLSSIQAQAEEPQLLPGATGPGAQSADPVDYSVAKDDSVRVAAAETLGHYADWLAISTARLRTLNHLHGRRPLVIGHRVLLEFSSVTPMQFEQRRRDYHERMEADYFAAHRIVGTQMYTARRGDTLWNITKHDLKVPIWLLQQYNPDLDFSDLKPGTAVALPKVEDVTGS
jgi:membrane-bound lytic murein transglycosylase D